MKCGELGRRENGEVCLAKRLCAFCRCHVNECEEEEYYCDITKEPLFEYMLGEHFREIVTINVIERDCPVDAARRARLMKQGDGVPRELLLVAIKVMKRLGTTDCPDGVGLPCSRLCSDAPSNLDIHATCNACWLAACEKAERKGGPP